MTPNDNNREIPAKNGKNIKLTNYKSADDVKKKKKCCWLIWSFYWLNRDINRKQKSK